MKHYLTILALDPSVRNTGICFISNAIGKYECSSFSREKGAHRYEVLATQYETLMKKYKSLHIDLAIVESYAFAANTNVLTQLAEVGGVLRMGLYRMDCPIIEIPSQTWKAITLGNGRIKKADVAKQAPLLYNQVWANQDECDAFLLAKCVEIALAAKSGEKELALKARILEVLGDNYDEELGRLTPRL